MRVLICGGGNASHVMLGLASANPKVQQVDILNTWQDEWKLFGKQITLKQQGKGDVIGKPGTVTNDVQVLKSKPEYEYDMIILLVPAFAHAMYMQQIKELLTGYDEAKLESVVVGAMPGQGGFDLCAKDALGPIYDKVNVFATETLPWACRIVEYGKSVEVLGCKKDIDMAVKANGHLTQQQVLDKLQCLITQLPVLHLLPSLLAITIMNINSVWHPCITYGQYRHWDGKTPFSAPPLFYEAVDDFTAELLSNVSNEILRLKATLESKYNVDLKGVMHVTEWMARAYQDDVLDKTNLRTSINSNIGYKGLTHPMVKTQDDPPQFMPNFQYRYLSEDLPCGLLVTKGLCELAGVETPHMDQVINWGQEKLGKEFLLDNKVCGKDVAMSRAPQRYGYKSLDELMRDAYL